MSKRLVMFTFTQEPIEEPVIYTLGQQFNLTTNLRRANVSEKEGWIVLELEGKEDDIEQGLIWVTSRGVRVNPVGEDFTEI